MNLPDMEGWTQIGANDSARYYLAEEGVIVVIPHENCVDTEVTARAAIGLQVDYWRNVPRAGASIVLMDAVHHQEASARRVYQKEIGSQWQTGIALVASSLFGRSIASIFLGLAKPPVPTRMFADLDSALVWLRSMNAARGNMPSG